MSVTIRRAKVEDYEAVNALETALVDIETDRRAMFEAVLAHPDHALVVAEVEGEVAGVAHLLVYFDLPHGELSGELLGLIVSERHRRQGIARALLEETLKVARSAAWANSTSTPSRTIARRRRSMLRSARRWWGCKWKWI